MPVRRQGGWGRWGGEPSLAERLNVHLLLAQALTQANKIPEATKVCLPCVTRLPVTMQQTFVNFLLPPSPPPLDHQFPYQIFRTGKLFPPVIT